MRHSDPEIDAHLGRMHAAIFDTYNLQDVVRYIEENTFLNGERFSFKDHEFQKTIISDTRPVINVQKCAQVGLSEVMARYCIAVCRIMPYFSTILTMPFSGDATNFVKTRIDPFIAGSPDLAESIDPDLDNSEIKGIGTSLFYARGTSGITTALSVPADMLVHDEVDRSDSATLAQYQSRIKHSRWKLTRKFGTPTADGVGIAMEMESSMRYRHVVKCHLCSHSFVPSYHTDVHIPGFAGDKREINKYNLNSLRWQEATLLCPRCKGEPSLQEEHREWVCENPQDNFEAIGYFVTPFSVPNVVSIPSLVKESTKYKTWTEFCNQALGETNNEDNQQLTFADLEACRYTASLDSGDLHCMGVDMGLICHLTVGRLTQEGILLIVHRERVLLDKLDEARARLHAKYHVVISVYDAFPYTDTILRMQKNDKNLYGGVYHDNKKMATYLIQHADPKAVDGTLPIHQARIHRNLNFDEVMYLFKTKKVLWVNGEDPELFVSHCLDMRRKQQFDRHNELVFVWVKSGEGQDHFMHSIGYLHVACRLMATASKNVALPAGLPIVYRLKVTEAKTPGRDALFDNMRN